jgi:NADH-quinone oxidoreductase subunit J
MQTMGSYLPVPFAQSDAIETAGRLSGSWSFSMLVPILLGAAGYLLLQHGIVKGKQYLLLGVIATIASIVGASLFIPPAFENYILFLFCSLATGGAFGFLTAREPIYAALGFATAVLSISGVMFMQSALFVAAANMIVYAGAIIIIFLFVLMFAQQTNLRTYDVKLTHPIVAAPIGIIVLGTLVYCLTADGAFPLSRPDSTRAYSEAAPPSNLMTEEGNAAIKKLKSIEHTGSYMSASPSTTSGLGRSLYTDYLLAVALAGTILTVAAVGAIALATKTTEEEV